MNDYTRWFHRLSCHGIPQKGCLQMSLEYNNPIHLARSNYNHAKNLSLVRFHDDQQYVIQNPEIFECDCADRSMN